MVADRRPKGNRPVVAGPEWATNHYDFRGLPRGAA
jgi:hypothetical protein